MSIFTDPTSIERCSKAFASRIYTKWGTQQKKIRTCIVRNWGLCNGASRVTQRVLWVLQLTLVCTHSVASPHRRILPCASFCPIRHYLVLSRSGLWHQTSTRGRVPVVHPCHSLAAGVPQMLVVGVSWADMDERIEAKCVFWWCQIQCTLPKADITDKTDVGVTHTTQSTKISQVHVRVNRFLQGET